MMTNDELLEQMQKSKIEMMDVDKLVPYARNAKLHTDEQVDELVALMREVGYTQPILLDENDEILAGHGRLLALKKMGMKKAPCIPLPHLTEAQKKAYRLADNQQVMKTGWDMDLLKIELNDLNGLNFDIGMIGFDDDFLNGLLATEPESEKKELNGDPDEVPESAPARVSRGDLWKLGDHRLMCGDSTSKDDVEKLLSGECPNLMITDPPYGVKLDQSWREAALGERLMAKTNHNVIQNDDRADWQETYALFPGNVAYVWHASKFNHIVRQNLEDVGLEVRQMIIWNKSVMIMGRSAYHWKHEPCWYAVRKGKDANWLGDRSQVTVWDAAPPNHIMGGSKDDKTEHPSQKPILVYEIPINNHTRAGDAIYEPFAGSGSALIAAEKTSRRCFAMELDQTYCDIILARWEKLTGKIAEKISP